MDIRQHENLRANASMRERHRYQTPERGDGLRLRVLIVLPGIFRINRGAEIAFLAIARHLGSLGCDVTVFGGGNPPGPQPFEYRRFACLDRTRFERWPKLPILRSEFCYEEATYAASLLGAYDPMACDITVTCSYPFLNWILSRRSRAGHRPRHVFVTQNSDWPAISDDSEYRWFSCDGLVCINPDYYERNSNRWNCALIPNGIDVASFRSSAAPPNCLPELPAGHFRVLVVSALSPYKRVREAVEACALVPNAHLVVLGDGPERASVEARAAEVMPGRFTRLTVDHDEIPSIYKACHVFLHLARDEPFGIVYLEAIASGLPVVAHDSNRTRWILGEEEYLIDAACPKEIARAIQRAAAEGSGGAERRQRHAERYDWRVIAKRYAEFFRALVGDPVSQTTGGPQP